jgi:hypothetical protein
LVRAVIQENIGIPGCDQLIRLVRQMVSGYFAFVFSVALESASSFFNICYQNDAVKTTQELLQVWTAIICEASSGPELDNAKSVLIAHLANSQILSRLCFFPLDSLSEEELKNEHLKLLLGMIVSLELGIAEFLHSDAAVSEELQNALELTIRDVFCPGLIALISVFAMDTSVLEGHVALNALRALSLLVIDFPDLINEYIDRQNAAGLVQVMKSLIGTDSPYSEDLIVLLGLICRWSETMREACVWVPVPTVLTKLCDMPLRYFIHERGAKILIPTIVACCLDNDVNMRFVNQSVNGALIAQFLDNWEVGRPCDTWAPELRVPKDGLDELTEKFRSMGE